MFLTANYNNLVHCFLIGMVSDIVTHSAQGET